MEEIYSIHGNLNYAAEVAPFGRPFLAPLITLTLGKKLRDDVEVTPLVKMSLRIWKRILLVNRGSTFKFVLSQLPPADEDIFVDAATE